MVLINNLKNADVQNLFLDLAYGTVIAEGDLCKTLKTDDGGVYVQHKLGRGEWDGVQSLYWRGFAIHSADYQFHPGTLSTGNSDTIQGVDSIFSMDIPHSLTAWMRALLPNSEVGSVDISTTTLEGLVGIYRTRKVNDYDSSGNVTGYGFFRQSGTNCGGFAHRYRQTRSGAD